MIVQEETPQTIPHEAHSEPSRLHHPSLWSRFLKDLDWSLIALILAIKVLLLACGVLSVQLQANTPLGGVHDWLNVWNRWDALHYQTLALQGYQATDAGRLLLPFFPLYPWTIRLLSPLIADVVVRAFLVSTFASIVAGVLLQKLVARDHSIEVARRAVLFLFIFPTSYFLHIGYTESLFLALTLGCLLVARDERWLWAGILGGLACLTRINGLLLFPTLLVEIFLRFRATRQWKSQWIWLALVPLGFLGYLLLNYVVTGDAWAFLTIQREHYYRALSWPWTGIGATIQTALGKTWWGRTPASAQMYGTQELVFVLIGLAGCIGSWLKLRPAYSVWMMTNWLLFVSTTFILAVPRYTLILFPLFILLARVATSRLWNGILVTWSLLFLGLFASEFVNGRWAF